MKQLFVSLISRTFSAAGNNNIIHEYIYVAWIKYLLIYL